MFSHLLSLDQTCLKLGRFFSIRWAETRDPDQAVMVATLLYKIGGHSRVLVDLGHADPCRKVHVLITNLFEDLPQSHFEEILEQIGADVKFTVEVAPVGPAADKLCWLQQRLYVLRPTRTYLLQHHHDFVCIAAAQPEWLASSFIFIIAITAWLWACISHTPFTSICTRKGSIAAVRTRMSGAMFYGR